MPIAHGPCLRTMAAKGHVVLEVKRSQSPPVIQVWQGCGAETHMASLLVDRNSSSGCNSRVAGFIPSTGVAGMLQSCAPHADFCTRAMNL